MLDTLLSSHMKYPKTAFSKRISINLLHLPSMKNDSVSHYIVMLVYFFCTPNLRAPAPHACRCCFIIIFFIFFFLKECINLRLSQTENEDEKKHNISCANRSNKLRLFTHTHKHKFKPNWELTICYTNENNTKYILTQFDE